MKKWLGTAAVLAVLTVAALAVLAAPANAGNTQVSGIGYPALHGDGTCDDVEGIGSGYAIYMTGDLEGCIYGFVTSSHGPGPSGVYKERADEIFVNAEGTFWLIENFHTKLDKFGFCKHPIVKGSGTGAYEGVTGKLDFRDDLVAGNFPYKGHLKM